MISNYLYAPPIVLGVAYGLTEPERAVGGYTFVLKQRILTGGVLALVALAAVFWLSVPHFALLTGLVIMFGAWEWANLAGVSHRAGKLVYTVLLSVLCVWDYNTDVPSLTLMGGALLWWLVAFVMVSQYPASANFCKSRLVRMLMGSLVLVPAWSAIVMLKIHHGPQAIVLLFLLVWAADVGAYVAGKNLGKRPLAKKVSPKKTIEGLLGGIAFSMLVAVVYGKFTHATVGREIVLVLLAMMVALISVLGDLLESLLKRERGIKDSSSLLPGHGGVMDRIDSLTAALPLFALALHFSV